MTPRFTRRNFSQIAMLALFIGMATLYLLVDPATERWIPKCIFHSITGFDCPGCGSQRMIHALLHGDLVDAWHYNACLIGFIPVIVVYMVLEFFPNKFPRGFRIMHSPLMIITWGIIIIAWGILRNII